MELKLLKGMRNISIKKSKSMIILLFFNLSLFSQTFSLNNSFNPTDNIQSTNNVTKINLFNIDYNGENIPICLSYYHNGVKINEPQSSLGLKWKLDNIGYINHKINYIYDNIAKGWFNTTDPNFNDNEYFDFYDNLSPEPNPANKNENDLSPDFFSVNMFNNNNFDFFFKKNIAIGLFGIPIPQFLSNPNGYRINTNFSCLNQSIPVGTGMDNRIVFNILDKKGNNYNFINGPTLQYNQSSSYATTNNYYIKSITSLNTLNIVTFDYILANNTITEEKYATGYTTSHNFMSQLNPNNGSVRNTNYEKYDIDNSRYDIKKILTNKTEVNFKYSFDNQYLEEINVNDINGNYITGYKFEYIQIAPLVKLLFRINKYNCNKLQLQNIYEFEYYQGDGFLDLSQQDLESQQYRDYLGYYNGLIKQSPFPITTQRNDIPGVTFPAGNFEQNIVFAKQHSLYQIKNIYSGIKQFDYRLNNEFIDFGYQVNSGNDPTFGNVYGGGIIISSVKEFPILGESRLTTYEHENFTGISMITEPGYSLINYSVGANITMNNLTTRSYGYFSSIPKLTNFNDSYLNNHDNGNFFKTITESSYNLSNMSLNSSIKREYITNTEGIIKEPTIKSEIIKNSLGNILNKIEYNYNFQNLETINSALFNVESRFPVSFSDSDIDPLPNYFHSIVRYFMQKKNKPIYVNRLNLSSIQKTNFQGNNTIINNTFFTYINNDSKILRSKSFTNTLGENIEEKYYYANDTQTSAEPYVNDLITANIIGVPLKTETYSNGSKIAEEKTVYAKDATTNNFLVPKYIYSKKGDDVNSVLEKKITYDSYDDTGNLLQYSIENGSSSVTIWGYNKTKPLAKIENLQYSYISSLVANLQALSNADIDNCRIATCKEQLLRNALNSLRATVLTNYPTALISTFTYDPLVGVTSVTDTKGDIQYYTYDTFQRLVKVEDKDGKILTEKEYNYKP
jgi:YD repeat-containing protein